MVAGGVRAEIVDYLGNVFDCKESSINLSSCYKKIDCSPNLWSSNFDGEKYAKDHPDSINTLNSTITEGEKVWCYSFGERTVLIKTIEKEKKKPVIQETSCASDKIYYLSGCYAKNDYCVKRYDSSYKWDEKIGDCAKAQSVVSSAPEQQRITTLKAMIESLKAQINVLLARLAQIKK